MYLLATSFLSLVIQSCSLLLRILQSCHYSQEIDAKHYGRLLSPYSIHFHSSLENYLLFFFFYKEFLDPINRSDFALQRFKLAHLLTQTSE